MAGEETAPWMWLSVEEQLARLREPPPMVFEGNPLRETAMRLALEEHEMRATTGDNKQCRCDGHWRTFREHREHVAKAIEARLCEMGY